MSTFALKITALILMFLDHTGLYFEGAPVWFRWLGRASYPLFLLSMVWGYHYTRNRKKYLLRLYLMSIFMTGFMYFIKIRFNAVVDYGYHNIFLSMFLVGVLISTIELFIKDRKKGGILINFDADYASNVRNQNTSASHISDTEVYGHCGVTPELEQENASITLSMPMSRKQRPYWDQEFLENIGFSRSGYDLSVGQNILKEHDLKDAPMFLVWGVR